MTMTMTMTMTMAVMMTMTTTATVMAMAMAMAPVVTVARTPAWLTGCRRLEACEQHLWTAPIRWRMSRSHQTTVQNGAPKVSPRMLSCDMHPAAIERVVFARLVRTRTRLPRCDKRQTEKPKRGPKYTCTILRAIGIDLVMAKLIEELRREQQ
jgi:hypothetical protein